VEVGDLDVDMVLDFLDHLERVRKNSVPTRNARLAAIHVFCRHVAGRDPRHFALCQRVLSIPVKRSARREIHYLEREEMDALLGAIDRGTHRGRRDYALVALVWQTGVRVAEVTGLRANNLQLIPPRHVRIWGKGRKERVVPLWSKTAQILDGWLKERNIEPGSQSPVFVNVHGQPLTRWGVRYLLKKHARAAARTCPSLATKRIHPHVMRHTAAVHMLQAGADATAIRDVLGHESAETTWRYTRIGIEDKRRAVESFELGGAKGDSPLPIWHRERGLLAELEAIGRDRD